MKRLILTTASVLALALGGVAFADLTVKDSAGATQTMFDFLCFSTKHCSTAVPITSAGVEILPATHADMVTLNATAGGPVAAGTNDIGGMYVAGRKYKTVAASQTATTLGGGLAGDYLSHCVIYPTSTSPGVVTVFDGTTSATNNVIAFAGGATSTSNLTPISVPVGAASLNSGGWKVTTGAAVSTVCYGKF